MFWAFLLKRIEAMVVFTNVPVMMDNIKQLIMGTVKNLESH